MCVAADPFLERSAEVNHPDSKDTKFIAPFSRRFHSLYGPMTRFNFSQPGGGGSRGRLIIPA